MLHVKNAIALTLSVTSMVYGQSARATRVTASAIAGAQEQASSVDERKKKVLRVFDELLESADVFADAEVRTIVQARIADLLWEYDPSRARSLITAAFHATAEIGLAPGVGVSSPYRVREEMMRIVARRDPVLALELVETALDRPPDDDPEFWDDGNGRYSQQAMLYSGLAYSASRSNPTLAAGIARMFIDKGHIEFGLRAARSLLPENADLARDLVAQAIAVAARDSERAVWNVRSLGGILFPTFGDGIVRFTPGEPDTRQVESAFPDLVPSFVELAYDVIDQVIKPNQAHRGAQGSNAPYSITDLGVARMMMPFFEHYVPNKAAILKARLTDAVRAANTNAFATHGDTANAVRLLTVQEMLDAAKSTKSPAERNHLYYEAAYQTLMNNQLAQAKEIAGKITDVPVRSLIDRYIQRSELQRRMKAAADAVHQRDFDNAYRLINELTDVRARTDLFESLAYSLAERKETADRAARVIGEAQRLILGTEISMLRARDQLKFAALAARVDLDRGFDDLRAAVATINSAKMPTQWSRITSGGLFESKDDGLGFLVPGLNDGFTIFGHYEFNRALQAARDIEMKEVSVFAQLAVCRGALKGYRF